jgi:predicted dehydrogenase/nucleoside-diphosphate-sugar epimerase
VDAVTEASRRRSNLAFTNRFPDQLPLQVSVTAVNKVTDRSWRVGLVGAGYVSQYHLRALKKLSKVKIVGIADFDHDRASMVASIAEVKGVFRSLREMAAAESPDVVHILTPPSSHCAIALEALDLGCHVFVEKPMALSETDCDQMIAKAAETRRILSVNHSARFDPALQKGLEAVRSGRIGDVLAVEYVRSSEYPPFGGGALPEHFRAGGYPFRDLGVHALYVIEAFLGEISHVEGSFRSTGRQIHLKFDEWHAKVTCARGSALIYLSWNALPMQNSIVVHGTAGRIIVDSFLETCKIERALPGPKAVSLIWNSTVGAAALAANVGVNAVRFATGNIGPSPDIQRSITEFYSALSKGTHPPVSAEEGRRIVAWVEKIARPADELISRSEPTSDRRPAQVLVTGAGGFLGRRLVDALLEGGRSVRALVRRPSNTLPDHLLLRLTYGDLGQPEVVDAAMDGIETVFHVGATTNGGLEDYQCGTIWGTQNVVEAALRHHVKKIVHVSSLGILDYVRLPEGSSVDEHSPLEQFPDQRGYYAKTKLQAEQIILGGVARGLNAVLVRPGQIFGPGAEHVAPYGVFSLGRRWIVMGRGQMELPLIYVDDVVDALIKAADAPTAPGEIVQVVDDQKITQREYISVCMKKLQPLRASYMPMPLLYGAAVMLEVLGRALGRSVPLTRYRLRALKGHLRFDCTAASRQLGWKPRTGVAEGMKITFGNSPASTAEVT